MTFTWRKLKAENWLKLFTTAGQRERSRLPRDHVFYGPGSFFRMYLATPAEKWGSHEEKVVWARAIGEDSQCILFPSGMARGGGPLGEWEVKESLKKPQKYIARKGSAGALIARLHQIHSKIHSIKPHCPFKQRRQWHPTPALLPWKSHGRRSLVGCSPWGRWELDMTERLHFHFSLSCIGERNGNTLQCSCLENPRDRGAWWAAVYRVAQSRTRLKRLSSSSSPFKTLSSYLLGLSTLEECEAAEQVGQEGARRVKEQTKSLFFIEDLGDLQSTALEVGGWRSFKLNVRKIFNFEWLNSVMPIDYTIVNIWE